MNYSPYSIVFLPYNNQDTNQNYQISPTATWNSINHHPYFQNQQFQYNFSMMVSDPKTHPIFSFQPHFPQINLDLCQNFQSQNKRAFLGKHLENMRLNYEQDLQKSYFGKQKQKKKYVQNPKRNVITNLGNQLLGVLGNKYKLNQILRKFSQKFDQELVSAMVIYVNQVRKAQNSYLSVQKMKDVWYPSNIDQQFNQAIELFRKVSYYYLLNYAHLQLVKSMKMREEAKIHHLRGIKSLICVLRAPPVNYSIKQQQ